MTAIPKWVASGAEEISGLDLLGLRLPVQDIGYRLLDGVTSVTPQVRYLSYVAWIADRYRNSGLPDSWQEYYRFSASIEAAFVMANLLHDPNTSGLIGPVVGRTRLAEEETKLSLDSLVRNLAISIYANVSTQLYLTFQSPTGASGLTEERGIGLAREFEDLVGGTAFAQRLQDDPTLDHILRTELEELGSVVALGALSEAERVILSDSLFPAEPFPSELPRLESLALFLSLAQSTGARVTEIMIFDATHEPPTDIPPEVTNGLAGWLQYSVRDLIAVANEVAFESVSSETSSLSNGGLTSADDVFESLLKYGDLFDDALIDLGLISENQSAADLSFNELHEKVGEVCGPSNISDIGLRYWEGGLSEAALMRACLAAGPGALILLPVAYSLALHRSQPMIENDALSNQFLARPSWARIGVSDVIATTVQEFQDRNPSLISAAFTLAHRSVDQHMRIAWSRAGNDLKRDVSVFTIEGDQWLPREGKQFTAGRTISRLDEALGWLGQLGLMNDTGLTEQGGRILERSLRVLREHNR
jgi:hypothetical protein